jgi:hypothetical protein
LEFVKEEGKKKYKSMSCGVRNIKDFEEWYDLIDRSINYTRVDFYRAVVLGLSPEEEHAKSPKANDHNVMKTLTELAIDNQMKIHDEI